MAMDLAGTLAFQSGNMAGRAVTFVSPKIVAWIASIERDHVAIPADFCQDGCRRDAEAKAIAPNDRTLWKIYALELFAPVEQ